jgi:hypothetical protein
MAAGRVGVLHWLEGNNCWYAWVSEVDCRPMICGEQGKTSGVRQTLPFLLLLLFFFYITTNDLKICFFSMYSYICTVLVF